MFNYHSWGYYRKDLQPAVRVRYLLSITYRNFRNAKNSLMSIICPDCGISMLKFQVPPQDIPAR